MRVTRGFCVGSWRWLNQRKGDILDIKAQAIQRIKDNEASDIMDFTENNNIIRGLLGLLESEASKYDLLKACFEANADETIELRKRSTAAINRICELDSLVADKDQVIFSQQKRLREFEERMV
jgi:hypothetical protein